MRFFFCTSEKPLQKLFNFKLRSDTYNGIAGISGYEDVVVRIEELSGNYSTNDSFSDTALEKASRIFGNS